MILITGNKGYIGTNLTSFLTEKGFKVKGFDVQDGKGVLNHSLLMDEMKGCNYVYHCAAISGIKDCAKKPNYSYAVNVKGTRNVVNIASMLNVKPIFFSSRAVFGESHYGYLKRVCECEFSLEAVILRLSNVYGGSNYLAMKPGNAIARFSKDNPIIIHGDGKQTRDFVHIGAVMDKCLEAQTLPFGIYDVCCGIEVSVETVALIAATMRGVPVKYKLKRE